MGRIIDERDIGQDVLRGPAAFHQLGACLGRIRRRADRRNNLIHIGHSHRETTENMRPIAGLAQFKGGAAGHNFFAEGDEMREKIAQGELFWTSAIECEHVTAK